MYQLGVFYSQPEHFGHFGQKCTGCGVFVLSRYILATLGETVPDGVFLFSAGTFWPFWVNMYWMGIFYSHLVHFRHFGRKCTGWGFFILSRYILAAHNGQNVPAENKKSSSGTFSPKLQKIYRLRIKNPHLVHFRLKCPKCTGSELKPQPVHFRSKLAKMYRLGTKNPQLVHFYTSPKCAGCKYKIPSRYFFAQNGQNVPAESKSFPAGTFLPKMAKAPSGYIFAQNGQNVPVENKNSPAGTFSPKIAKTYWLRVKNSQAAHCRLKCPKCTR